MKSQDRPMYIPPPPPPRGNGNLMSRKITRGLVAVSAACALGAAVILAACDSPATPVTPVTPDQSLSTTVRGKVTDAKNQGVEGVRISASGTAGDVTPVTTRSDGTFTLKVPHRGGFTLTAAKNGYDDKSQDFTTDKTAEIWDISLDFATTVSGKVSTDGTAGLAGVTVSVDGRGDITPVTTGDDGNYSLRVTHKGRFTLAAAKDGYVGQSRTFELTAVTPTATWNITLEGAAVTTVVSGTVTGPISASAAGNLEGVTISVEGRSDITPVTTMADGTYPNLSVPHTGSFTLRAAKNGYNTETATVTAPSSGAEVKNFTLALTETPVFEFSKVRKSKMLVSTNGNANQTFENPLLSRTIFAPEGNPVTAGAVYSIIDKPAGLTNEITLVADGTVSFGKPALDKVNADGPLTVTIQAAYQGKTAAYDFTVTDHFSEREVYTAVWNDTLYIVGGTDGNSITSIRDVWKSTDAGSTFTKVEVTSSFWRDKLAAYSTVAANGTIYVTGGYLVATSSSDQNRVWKSTDGGKTWQELTTGTKFSARADHTTLAIGTDIYVIGGSGTGGDQVWKSSDGDNWAQVTTSASTKFSGRRGHSSVYIPSGTNAGMYVIGGYVSASYNRLNDVWKSTDGGVNWTEVTTSTSTRFSARNIHSSVVLGQDIYVIGGFLGTSGRSNDVWKSTDGGANWTRVTANAAFGARSLHGSVAFGQAIYVFGGTAGSGSYYNDVWKSTDGGVTWVNVHKTTP